MIWSILNSLSHKIELKKYCRVYNLFKNLQTALSSKKWKISFQKTKIFFSTFHVDVFFISKWMKFEFQNHFFMNIVETSKTEFNLFRAKKIFRFICRKFKKSKWKKHFKKHESTMLKFNDWCISQNNELHMNAQNYTLNSMFKNAMKKKFQLKHFQMNFFTMFVDNDSHLSIHNISQSEQITFWTIILNHFENNFSDHHVIHYILQIMKNNDIIFEHENSFLILIDIMKIFANNDIEMIQKKNSTSQNINQIKFEHDICADIINKRQKTIENYNDKCSNKFQTTTQFQTQVWE